VATDAVRPNEEFDEWRWVEPPWPEAELSAPPNVWQLADRAMAAQSIDASGGDLIALARRWLAAFNGRDLDGLVGLYAEDAVHLSPKLRAQRPETLGRVTGRPALAAWWRDAFARLPSLRYREIALTAGDGRVFMEYERIVDGEPPLAVAEVLEVAAGAIVASRVYHG
jgi:limonene-1,2-epoxide hydrolase